MNIKVRRLSAPRLAVRGADSSGMQLIKILLCVYCSPVVSDKIPVEQEQNSCENKMHHWPNIIIDPLLLTLVNGK
jgi:hypothetical protein